MKTIKSALLGIRKLEETTSNEVMLFNLREILAQHRALIINRLVSDLPTYFSYKFDLKLSAKAVQEVKERLLELKNSSVDLDHFQSVVTQVKTAALIHLTNEPFYTEIDQFLSQFVSEPKLVA